MGFLEDFIYKSEQQEVMSSAISGALDILKTSVDEVDRNINLSKLLTYKKIQFQRIDITNIAYSLNSLLNNSQVISLMGVTKNTSMEKRLEIWNSMTALEQANILDMVGYYLEFTDNILSSLTDDLKKKKFDIIDFELCDLGNNLLIRNVDYVFYDNKLMLLKEFFGDSSYKKKYLIMKNIVIDAGLTESVLGGFMHMPSNKELTKVEYNEILKGFTEAASKGPIIGEYGVALNRYKSLEGVRVYDKFNADTTRRFFWGTDEKLGEFTKFDFIVSMPVQLVYKPEKLDYIINFFNQTKPAYANFVFSPELLVTDTIAMKAKPTLFKTKSWMSGIKDNIKAETIPEYFNKHWLSDNYLLNKRARYKTIQDSMHRVYDKWEEIVEKQTEISYLPTNYILDFMSSKTKIVVHDVKALLIDKVQIGRGIGGDAYILDEDYFDLQVIADPLFSQVSNSTIDILTYNSSSITTTAIPNLKENIKYEESYSKYSEGSILDRVKIINTKPLDDSYETDKDDYVDDQGISDPLFAIAKRPITDILQNKSSSILRKPTMSIKEYIDYLEECNKYMKINISNNTDFIEADDEINWLKQYADIKDSMTHNIRNSGKVSVLNAKNLYDRMNNVDITSKTIIDQCFNNAHLINKANIIECDSIFDCDYSEESCMVLDSVPDNYNEGVKADFVSRELISLELIPKNN